MAEEGRKEGRNEGIKGWGFRRKKLVGIIVFSVYISIFFIVLLVLYYIECDAVDHSLEYVPRKASAEL